MAFDRLRFLPLAVWIICGTLAVCETRSRLKRGNLEDNIPGKPDRDYPIFAEVPRTSFKCTDQEFAGFYADMEARCQVFHICQKGGRQDSFLCPNGTVFSQQYFVCDWWYNFNCNAASSLYTLNSKLYATEEPINDPVNVEKQVLDPSFLRSAAKDGSRARMPINMKLVPSGAMPPGLSAAAIDPQASKTRTAASLRTHHVSMATTPKTLPTIRQQVFDEQAPPGGYEGQLDEQIQQEPVQHVEEPLPSPRPTFTSQTQKPFVTSPRPSPSRPETASSPFPSTISIAFPPKPTLPFATSHQGDDGDQYNPNDEFGDYPDIDVRFQQASRVPEPDQPSSVPPSFSRQPQKQPQTLPLKRLPPPSVPQRQQSIPPPPQSLPTPSSFEPTPSFQPTPPSFQSQQSSLPPPPHFPPPQRPLPPPQRPLPPPQRPLPPPQQSFPSPQRPFPPPQQSFPPPTSFPPSSSSSFASPPPFFPSQQSFFPTPTPQPFPPPPQSLPPPPPPPPPITSFTFRPTQPTITSRPEFPPTGFRQHPQESFNPPPPPRFFPPPPQITSTLPPPDIFISHPPPPSFSPAPPITFTPPPLEMFSSPPSHPPPPPPPPPRFSLPPPPPITFTTPPPITFTSPPPPAPISLPPPPVTVFSERPPTPHVSSTTPRPPLPPSPQPPFVSQQTISTPPTKHNMEVSVTHFGLPSTTPLPPSASVTTQSQFSKSVSSTERPSSLQGLRVVPAPNLFLQRPNQGFQPLEGFPQPSGHQQVQNQLNFGLDARKPKLMNQQFPTPPQQFVSDGRPIDLQEIMRFNQIQLQNGQFPNVNHGQLSIHRPSFDTFPTMPNLQPLQPPPFSQQHFGFQNSDQQLLNFRNQFMEQQRFQQFQQGLQQLPRPFKGQQQFVQGPFPQFPLITSNIPLFPQQPQQPQQLQDLRPISDVVQQGQRTAQQTFQFPPQRQPDFQQQFNNEANQQQQQQNVQQQQHQINIQQHQQNIQQQQHKQQLDIQQQEQEQQQQQQQKNIQQQQKQQQHIQQQQKQQQNIQQQKQQQNFQQQKQQQNIQQQRPFLQQQKPIQFQHQQDNHINAQQNQGPKNIPLTNQEQFQQRPIPLPPPGMPQTFTVAPPPFRDLDEHDDNRPDFPDNDRPDFQDNDRPDFDDDGDDDQQQHHENLGNQDLQLDVRDFVPPPPPPPPPPRPNFGSNFGQQRPFSIPPPPPSPPPPSRPDFGPGPGPDRPPSIPPPPPPPRPHFGPGPDQQRPSSIPPPPPPRPDFGPGPGPDQQRPTSIPPPHPPRPAFGPDHDQQRPSSIPPPPPPRPDFGPPGPGQDKPSSIPRPPPPPPPRPDFFPGPDQQGPFSRLPPLPPRPDFGPGFGQERPFSIPSPPRPPFDPSHFGPRPSNPPQHNFNPDRPSSIPPPPPPQQQFPPPPPQQRFPPPPPQQRFPPHQQHINFEPTTLPPVFIPSSSPVTPEIQIFSEEEKRSKKIKSQRPTAVTPRPNFVTSPIPRPPIDDGPQHSTIRPPPSVDDEFRQPPNFTPRPGISVPSRPPEITTAHPQIIATTPGSVRVVSTPQPQQFFNQDFPQRPQFGPPPPLQQEQRPFQNIPPQNFQNTQNQDSFRHTQSGFQSSVKGFQNVNTQEQRFQFFRQQDMHNMNVQRPGNNLQGNNNNNGQFNFQGNNDIQRPDQGRNQFNFQGNNMNIQRPNGNGFQDNFQTNNNFRKPLILDVPNQATQNKFQQSQQNVQNQNNLQSQQQFHQQGNINGKENFPNNGNNQHNFQNQNNQQTFQNQNNQQNFQTKGNTQQNFQNQNNQQNFQKSQNFQNNFPQDFPRQDLIRDNKNQGPWNPDRPLSGLNLSPAAFNNNDPNLPKHQKSALPNNIRQPFVFPFPTLPPIFVPVSGNGEMSVNSLISDISSIDDDGEPKRNIHNQETHQNPDLSSYAPSPREDLETKY